MKQLSLDLPAVHPLTDHDRISNRLELGTKVVRPEWHDDEERLQLRLDLERGRGHIRTSFGSR